MIRYLCPFARLFSNPFHLSGVIFAMLITNMATLFWAGIVLLNDDSLARSRISFVAKYADENVFAAVLGGVALAQLVCLALHLEPTRFRNIGYFILSMWWGFVFFYNITELGPIFPTATALSFAIAFAAFYAWLDGQTLHGDSDADSR